MGRRYIETEQAEQPWHRFKGPQLGMFLVLVYNQKLLQPKIMNKKGTHCYTYAIFLCTSVLPLSLV